MKKKSIFFVAALSIISSAAVFAASDDTSVGKDEGTKAGKVTGDKATSTYKQVSLETLQKQLNALQHQIADMKKQQVEMKKKEVVLTKKQEETAQKQSAGLSGSAWSKLYGYGPTITTTPIIGEPDYAGWDLYINHSSGNEDMDLIKRRDEVYSYYAQNGIAAPDRPVVALTGSVEAQANNSRDYDGGNTNDIDLTTVALEAVINVNEWVTGMIKFTYLDLPPSDHDIRANTGDVFVDRAYITAGNLDKFPIFASIGQMKVPFEFDFSYTITDTSTKNLGKMVERPAVLGFGAKGFYGKLYAFKGDIYEGNDNNTINNWGGMLGYKGQLAKLEKVTVDIGAGAIKNLADALGLQDTANSKSGEFQGFKQINANTGEVISSKQITSTVPAASAHAIVHYGSMIDFVADYVGAINRFDQQDMTFNDDGAKPQAIDLEAQYNFNAWGKPSSVGVAFDRTWEALAANLPKYSYFVFVSTSLWKRTVQAIEWRHDTNYDDSDTATGQGLPVTTNGKHQDIVTAKFAIYF